MKNLILFFVAVLIMIASNRVSAAAVAAKVEQCNYCEGYAVLEKALSKVPAPKGSEMQTQEQAKIVTLADKLVGEIFIENPKLEKNGLEILVKTLAKTSQYDPGNELVSNFWDKLKPRLKDIEKSVKSLSAKKLIRKIEADRFIQAIAVQESVILNGTGE